MTIVVNDFSLPEKMYFQSFHNLDFLAHPKIIERAGSIDHDAD